MAQHGPAETYRDVAVDEAVGLVRDGAACVLDVRSPEEYETLGHIPGAILLPLQLLPVALATLAETTQPLLVCCEHGIRSVAAAEFLVRSGVSDVRNLAGGMALWTGPREFSPGTPFGPRGPSSWIVENADLLPETGSVLDVACGRGRHALLLASARFDVLALDRDPKVIGALVATARRAGIPLRAEVLDLEVEKVELGAGVFDVILGVHYLFRPLFPRLVAALRPGGLLLYETFTVDQAQRGKPTNPAFLLEKGELCKLVAPLTIVRQREGEFEQRCVASVAARKSVE